MVRRIAVLVAMAGLALVACTSDDHSTATTAGAQPARRSAPHVVIVMLENTNYDESFGPGSAMPYLAGDLAPRGVLLRQFHGIAHPSLGNYIAQISGQAPNPSTQEDCVVFTDFVQTGLGDYGQVLGDGCVYPAQVPTIADQLADAGLSWRVYAQDMAAAGEPTTCRHPAIGAQDPTVAARSGDNYATRHVPFLYFHSVIDSPDCAAHVVDLGLLAGDFASVATTPTLAYVVPGLCDDGHDSTCADGTEGGAARADAWLRAWMPTILASPAMADGGLLVITFDEAESGGSDPDASACCGELPAPNLHGRAGISGPGGGRIGAVVIGAAVAPGSISDVPYDHYSLLCSLERLWGLGLLGYAAHPSPSCFGGDVYTADPTIATG